MKGELFAQGVNFAAIANQFLLAAMTLNEAQKDQGKALFLPTLALAGHGLEMMLKACFFLNNKAPVTKGKKGHDIVSMWHDNICEPIRGHVFVNAHRVVADLRDDARGYVFGIPKDEEILTLIDKYVIELGSLHGGAGYPLRYPTETDRQAPKTPFLVMTLYGVADDMVKRPHDFEVSRFQGRT
ncbi:hypothetical protein [Ahrensia sp. 13_GOM-1096m]|uniref:hypothetical protein n=1 Tax=Ahrensia sp. 13_GOM-1096m TaxID=1380380 RepID=UPI0004794D45|nr:hypothetical protein [Ahrensia sp. 13_GOM-1096m]